MSIRDFILSRKQQQHVTGAGKVLATLRSVAAKTGDLSNDDAARLLDAYAGIGISDADQIDADMEAVREHDRLTPLAGKVDALRAMQEEAFRVKNESRKATDAKITALQSEHETFVVAANKADTAWRVALGDETSLHNLKAKHGHLWPLTATATVAESRVVGSGGEWHVLGVKADAETH